MTCHSFECQQGRKPCENAACSQHGDLPVEMLDPEPLPFGRWIFWLAIGWWAFTVFITLAALAGYWSK